MNLFKKTFPILLSCLFFASCSNNKIEKDGLIKCKFDGTLSHTQYWNQHDEWDLKGVNVQLFYDDNSIITIDASDDSISLVCYPASPSNLPSGTGSFEITSAYYTDYKGVKYEIEPIKFNNITIVDYPYENNEEKILNNVLFDSIIFFFICICFTVLVVILLKKRKESR